MCAYAVWRVYFVKLCTVSYIFHFLVLNALLLLSIRNKSDIEKHLISNQSCIYMKMDYTLCFVGGGQTGLTWDCVRFGVLGGGVTGVKGDEVAFASISWNIERECFPIPEKIRVNFFENWPGGDLISKTYHSQTLLYLHVRRGVEFRLWKVRQFQICSWWIELFVQCPVFQFCQ